MQRWLAGVLLAAVAAMVPRGATAGNQETAERIAAVLAQSGQLRNYQIAVLCQDRTAWLHGQVATQDQMNVALQLAFEVPGIRRVVNHLVVVTGDAPKVAARPGEHFPRVPGATEPKDTSPGAEASSGNGLGSRTGMSPHRLVRGWNPTDKLPEPVPVPVPGLKTPRSQGSPFHPERMTADSRLPWTPDRAVAGPLSPVSIDLIPVQQPTVTKGAETKADVAGVR